MSLKIFITGGTTGIGLALAKLYLDRGETVGVCGRDLSKLTYAHPNLSSYQVNVQERDELIRVVGEFAQGKLDIFIANAGRAISNKTSIPDFLVAHDVINTNVGGMLNSFEAALEVMLKQKSGQIVAVASVAGMIGLPGAAAYCASKAAVLKLCEAYTLDLAKKNITVTTIAPGFIDTPLTEKNSHKMPFLMSAQKSAVKIDQAITKKQALYIFPWQMKIVISILSHMPRSWYMRLMNFSFLNYNKNN